MNESKGQRIYRMIMLILITVLLTALITTVLVYNKVAGTTDIRNIISSGDNSGLELTLSKIRAVLEERYMGEINDEKMIESAIKGYVAGLGDEYAEYYTPSEMSSELDEAYGNYVGIGITMLVSNSTGKIVISETMKDSPAEKVGLKTGDIITKVDGEEVTTENIGDMTDKIKGEEGTKVKLEIKRGEETLNIEVERKRIIVTHTESKKLEGNIGYIAISDFDGGMAKEFETKYNELKKEGITSLIIDIRDNGGGVVDEAIDMLELLSKRNDTLLITVDKSNNEEITKSKSQQKIIMPIVVLVNQYSASASEILAGALQDNGRAKLVGTKTYGKGVIQTLIEMSDGSGLKMTTEEYYTPNHNRINKVGITPDYEVELSNAVTELGGKDDTQLQKAIELLK